RPVADNKSRSVPDAVFEIPHVGLENHRVCPKSHVRCDPRTRRATPLIRPTPQTKGICLADFWTGTTRFRRGRRPRGGGELALSEAARGHYPYVRPATRDGCDRRRRLSAPVLPRGREARSRLGHRRQLLPRFLHHSAGGVPRVGAARSARGTRAASEQRGSGGRDCEPGRDGGRHDRRGALPDADLHDRRSWRRSALPLWPATLPCAAVSPAVSVPDGSNPGDRVRAYCVSAAAARLAVRYDRHVGGWRSRAARGQRPRALEHDARSRRSLQRHPLARLAADARDRPRLLHRPAFMGARDHRAHDHSHRDRDQRTSCRRHRYRRPLLRSGRRRRISAQRFRLARLHRGARVAHRLPARHRHAAIGDDLMSRGLVLAACLLLSAGYLAHASRTEDTLPRIPFSRFPMVVADWQGHAAPDFDPQVISVLGVDEYVNRTYVRNDQEAQLYVGYYRSQREGSQIHSPMNCLPGAGWAPVTTATASLAIGPSGERAVINRYLIQKGLDKRVVMYWYQS